MRVAKLPINGAEVSDPSRKRTVEAINALASFDFPDWQRDRTSFEIGAGVSVIHNQYPPGDVRRYGAIGDDSTDNADAIADAVAQMEQGGADVYFPPGTYRTDTAITLAETGGRIRGEDWATTIVKFTAAVNGLVVSGQHARVSGIWFHGNSTGLTGLIEHNSFLGVFEKCSWSHWTADGGRVDEEFGSPTGNCNETRHRECNFFSNTGKGFACPTLGSDMNNLEFSECYLSGNSSHGLLIKGQAWRMRGGIVEGNGAYGIQIGEDGDSSVSTCNVIDFPYIESNTSGGVRGSQQSQSNLILIDNLNVGSGYSAHASSENMAVWMDNTGGGFMVFGDATQQFRIYNTTSGTKRIQLVAEGSDSDIPMWLYSKGSSAIALNPSGGGPGVVIGADTLNTKTLLQLDSTTRGFLTPRMTETQRDNIASPPEGLEIWNTTTHKKNWYNGSAWKEAAEV